MEKEKKPKHRNENKMDSCKIEENEREEIETKSKLLN